MTFSIVGSLTELIIAVLSTVGLPGLLALMAVESFGLPPIPSEVILPFTGFLVADGTFPFAGAAAVALVGGLVGAFAAYAIGRWWRHRILGLGVGRLKLEPHHLERVDRYFARRGESTVALTRMVPVIRSYISYPAGTAKMDPVKFGVYTLLGSIPFTVGLIYAGAVLRSNWTAVAAYLSYLDYPLIALVVGIVLFFLLQIGGYLEPGWPPRRRARNSESSAGSNSPDARGS